MNDSRTVQFAVAVADQLADPELIVPAGKAWWLQHLAHGAPGIALLHIELAGLGLRPWTHAHDWLTAITSRGVDTGPETHLYYGAPAIAHALTCAAAVRPDSYGRALATLDATISTTTTRRVKTAHARIDRGEPATLAEFDAIRGLTGIGAHLLRRDPSGAAIRDVLGYLVRLTEPITDDGQVLPGWWVPTGPSGRADEKFPGGHVNSGMAHGIGGPLALLALASQRGVVVHGQAEAIDDIRAWLTRWRIQRPEGLAWPYWVTQAEMRAGRLERGRSRPSWCYGTGGLARAHQLAALAAREPGRRHEAEAALVHALTDPAQLSATADASLCHGYAGLAYLARRTASDAGGSAPRLHALAVELLDTVVPPDLDPQCTAYAQLEPGGPGPAFLEGAVGIALAALAADAGPGPVSGWDTCLLAA